MRLSVSIALAALMVSVQASTTHHGAGWYKKQSTATAQTGTSTVDSTSKMVTVTTTKASASTAKAAGSTSSVKTSSVAASTSTSTSSTSGNGASCTFPDPPSTSSLTSPITVAAGESFDCGNVRYDRGSGACEGQTEGGDSDAVFLLEAGASLSNCVIGADQSEGVHCFGGCTLTNIWWEDVCEDAFTVKTQDDGVTTYITGGGAKGADDKVVQHNGGGSIVIDSFCVETFGKLYRSCGNCDDMYERHVTISNVDASNGSVICGINSNYGDTCTVTSSTITDVDHTCVEYKGNDSGAEPTKIASDVQDAYCSF